MSVFMWRRKRGAGLKAALRNQYILPSMREKYIRRYRHRPSSSAARGVHAVNIGAAQHVAIGLLKRKKIA